MSQSCQAIISDHSLIICRAEGAMLGPMLSADCTSLFNPGAVVKMWLEDLSETGSLLDQRPYLLCSEVYCHSCMKATLPLGPRSQAMTEYDRDAKIWRHGYQMTDFDSRTPWQWPCWTCLHSSLGCFWNIPYLSPSLGLPCFPVFPAPIFLTGFLPVKFLDTYSSLGICILENLD